MAGARVRVLLRVTQVGHLHGLVGNVYEAVARVPDHLAALPAAERPRGPLAAGSPARYHLPAMPFTTPVTVAALLSGWDARRDRAELAAALGCSAAATALTGYLVRTVNLPLLLGDREHSPAQRRVLLRRWYRLNLVRIAALSGVVLIAQRVLSR